MLFFYDKQFYLGQENLFCDNNIPPYGWEVVITKCVSLTLWKVVYTHKYLYIPCNSLK